MRYAIVQIQNSHNIINVVSFFFISLPPEDKAKKMISFSALFDNNFHQCQIDFPFTSFVKHKACGDYDNSSNEIS